MNKKSKISLAFIILIILISNIIFPSLSFAIEQDSNEVEIDENNIIDNIVEENDINDEIDDKAENNTVVNNITDNSVIENMGIKDEREELLETNEESSDYVENENTNNEIMNYLVEENLEVKENIVLKNEVQENEEMNQKSETRSVANEEFSLFIMDDVNRINLYEKNGKNYIFVPKDIDLSEMVINYTGNIESVENASLDSVNKQITGNFSNESMFIIKLSNGNNKYVTVMQSDVPAIFVDLDSNVTLETVNTGSKDTKYVGSVNVRGCNKDKDNISQNSIEFKGRGNTSWAMPKKSYQIKLNKKANFLGIGSSKEKKWVLVANYQDPTLLKNKIINDLCVQSGLAQCPNSSFADLYVNGDYVGNYLVCDKVEIKENRVNLSDEKGLLVEIDNAYYDEEDYFFRSKRGNFYAVKEAVSEDDDQIVSQAMNSFKNSLDAFEDELYSSNPSWNKISRMIDVDSFVNYYLINEFAINTDSYFSSCFLYKDGDNDVIHMGPTWDYDASMGYTIDSTDIDYTIYHATSNDMQALYKFPMFAKLVNEKYETVIKPIINKISINKMSKENEKSKKINTLVWSNNREYTKLLRNLNTFVENRKNYFNSRYSNQQIEYSTHVEKHGWMISQRNGVSGTEGQSLRIEGLILDIGSGYGENVSIEYRSHVQGIGWQNWTSNGNLTGTTGKGLRLEAIQIKLKNTSEYSIRYRVHIQDIGWQDWKYDGEIAGTEGKAKRIEAIEIQIVEGRNRLGSNEINKSALLNYKAHIQNVGDTGYGCDGEIIGTIGRSLRLEGIKLIVNKTLLPNISIQADVHVQNKGWIKGLTDKQYIGTQGEGLRMEAIKMKLVGDNSNNYDIKYRVHVENIGWQDWKKNGQMAGTENQAKRIEAIQICIVEK